MASVISKGRQVYVEGRLTTREYEAKDGSGKRYRTEIIARQIRFLDRKPDAGASKRRVRAAKAVDGMKIRSA